VAKATKEKKAPTEKRGGGGGGGGDGGGGGGSGGGGASSSSSSSSSSAAPPAPFSPAHVSAPALCAELGEVYPFHLSEGDDDGLKYIPSAEADVFHATYAAQFLQNRASAAPVAMVSPFMRASTKDAVQPVRALVIRSPPLPGGGAPAGAASATLLLHPGWLLPHDLGEPDKAGVTAAAIAADAPTYDHRVTTLRAFFPPDAPATSMEALLAYAKEPRRRFAFCLLLHQRPRGLLREAAAPTLPPRAPGAPPLPPHRSLTTVQKAVVRVEAVYEIDDAGHTS
jgi:hypothetical protein